ncbi:restriction endonuclease subunit S [Corynebacterium freneyi]
MESWTGKLTDAESDSTASGTPFQRGDVLFGKLRPYLAKSWLADESGTAQGDIHVYRPHASTHPKYLAYIIRSREFVRFANAASEGVKMPRVEWTKLRSYDIPLPDLPKQRRIADYLDRETAQIDAMAEALDGLVARLEERRRGLFKTATGDTRQASLAVISRITLGKMLDGNKNKGIPTPYIRAANVERTGKIDTDDLKLMKVTPAENATYSLRADDIIMVEGGDAGRVGYVNQDLPGIAFQKTVMRIRCHTKYSFPRYVYYALDDAHKSGRISLDYSLSTIPHFPAEKAARLEIPLPPLDEQRRIADHLDAETAKIDAMIAKAGELRALLDERRSALITATVTGQHPVPEEP